VHPQAEGAETEEIWTLGVVI